MLIDCFESFQCVHKLQAGLAHRVTRAGEVLCMLDCEFDAFRSDHKSREVAQAISGVHGAADVQVESPPGAPRIAIRLRPQRLRQLGFRPIDVMEAVGTAYEGTTVAQNYEANRVFDVSVILDERIRQNPEAVGGLMLTSADGLRVPLREPADMFEDTGRTSILHEGARRRQAVTCDVRGRDLTGFVNEARRAVRSKVTFPGRHVCRVRRRFSGARADAARDPGQLAGGRCRHRPAAGSCLPKYAQSAAGSRQFAVRARGRRAGCVCHGRTALGGGMVGFVTLFGITMRNSMMMISHFEHLVTQEGMSWGREAMLRGASERLVPILMTAIVTALGLLPLALGSGEPGREIEGPMAVVILGGLVTSTLLNLLVLPTLALRYGRFEPRSEE